MNRPIRQTCQYKNLSVEEVVAIVNALPPGATIRDRDFILGEADRIVTDYVALMDLIAGGSLTAIRAARRGAA